MKSEFLLETIKRNHFEPFVNPYEKKAGIIQLIPAQYLNVCPLWEIFDQDLSKCQSFFFPSPGYSEFL
jgi:hypothetical protein